MTPPYTVGRSRPYVIIILHGKEQQVHSNSGERCGPWASCFFYYKLNVKYFISCLFIRSVISASAYDRKFRFASVHTGVMKIRLDNRLGNLGVHRS